MLMTQPSASESARKPIPLNLWVRHFLNLFFLAPFFWGTQKRRLLLPKRAAALSEGTQWGKGGTGKAEDAKLPDAGISLKQCPGK